MHSLSYVRALDEAEDVADRMKMTLRRVEQRRYGYYNSHPEITSYNILKGIFTRHSWFKNHKSHPSERYY